MQTKPRTWTPWSAAQDEQLRQLLTANTPATVIGQRMSRKPEDVLQHAHEIGALERRTRS